MSYWENTGKSNEWYTPKYIFDALECTFDTDVAAPQERTWCSVPADSFITENSLELRWVGFCWMNPPFGGRNEITQWIEKMCNHQNGIALTPDRTSARWWQISAEKCDAILFIHGKVKFHRPDGSIGKQPSTGTTLFGFGKKAVHALRTAYKNNLGTLLINE